MDYLNKYLDNKYLIPAAVSAVVLIIVAGAFLFYKNKAVPTPNNNPQVAQEEVKKLVSEVSKLIDLPTGEDPTVATITDITKLKDQPFFQKAKNGDKVLIYTKEKKAILYDPNMKKVLDAAPLNIGSSSAQIQPKIALRNGTTIVGLTTKAEGEIKKIQPQIAISSKDNASRNNYESTLVIILNSSFKDIASSLANKLKGASVSAIPVWESKPIDADILIILGKDRI